MSQANDIVKVLKKQHFWLLCLLVVVLAPASCMMTASALTDRFTKRKNELDKQTRDVQGVFAKPGHPNEEYKKAIEERHAKLIDDVNRAAGSLYQDQRRTNTLPAVVVSVLPGFQDEFDKRWAAFDKLGSGEEMDSTYRYTYREKMAAYCRTLGLTIEWRYDPDEFPGGLWPVPGQGGVRVRPRDDKKTDTKKLVGIVDWDDFGTVYTRLTKLPPTPSTLEVVLTQEDLWVYEALLRIVRQTNNMSTESGKYEKPPSRKAACIKRIAKMEIGQDAVKSWEASADKVVKMPASAEGERAGEAAAPLGGPAPAAHGGRDRDAAGRGPMARRYVDDRGKPVADPSQQPYPEFRMMPINLRLVIEQKALPRLLAECVNCSMPIDVRNVRLLLQQPPPLELTGEGEPASGGEFAPKMPSSGLSPHTKGFQTGPTEEGTTGIQKRDEDGEDPFAPPVPVEIQGIIYIYTPPATRATGNADTPGAAGQPDGTVPGPAGTPVGPVPTNPVPTTPGTPASPVNPAGPPALVNPGAPATPAVPPLGAPGAPPAVPPQPGTATVAPKTQGGQP